MSDFGTLALGALGYAVVLMLIYRRLFNPGLARQVAHARHSGSVEHVRESLRHLVPNERQPVAYDSAIQQLWNAYERELTVPLIEDFVVAHPEERIARYWLDQLQRVEPELASRLLGSAFVAENLRPDIVATCGRFG